MSGHDCIVDNPAVRRAYKGVQQCDLQAFRQTQLLHTGQLGDNTCLATPALAQQIPVCNSPSHVDEEGELHVFP